MKIANLSYSKHKSWVGLSESCELDSENTLLLVFCSPSFRDQSEIFMELKKSFPNSTIVGCSSAGEIENSRVLDNTLCCKVIKFEKSSIKYSLLNLDSFKSSESLGAAMGENLNAVDLSSVILLSDGLNVDGSALCAGINSVLNKKVLVAGGLAADGKDFKDTFIILNEKIIRNSVIAVGIYGNNLHVKNSSSGGWDIFGPERIITKSEGNVVYEINGKPALDLYKDYLGEQSKNLPVSGLHFPLQIRKNEQDENKLIRTLLSIDEDKKSLTFAGSIPEFYLVTLMRANYERLISAASDVGSEIKTNFKKPNNELTFVISCVGRRMVLGERIDEELEALKESASNQSHIIGFYSYGEIGASVEKKACELHNQSMTALSLSEDEEAA